MTPTSAPHAGAALLAAADFAARQHASQRRKDLAATPYINHPLAVAELLARVAGVTDVEILQAALLHDVLEDTNTSREELEAAFGARVMALVMEVTDDKSLPQAERKRLQVAHAAHLSPGARLIKLADKICNLRDITPEQPPAWPVARKLEYLEWAAAVVGGCRGTNAALEAFFDRTLSERRSSLGVR